jgi:hypothetical protein
VRKTINERHKEQQQQIGMQDPFGYLYSRELCKGDNRNFVSDSGWLIQSLASSINEKILLLNSDLKDEI